MKQLEFYLGDANLSKDRYLSQTIRKNPEIPVDLFLSFNKIRSITCDVKDLVTAIRKSSLLALTEDEAKVFRKTQIQKRENLDECTIYVENIPSDAHHDWLQRIFSIYGNVLYVSIPKFKNKTNKGFAFIEFDLPKCVTKALEDGGKALYNPRKKMQDLTLPLTPYLPAMSDETPTAAVTDEKEKPTAILGKRKRNTSDEDSASKKTKEEDNTTECAAITDVASKELEGGNTVGNAEMLELDSDEEDIDSDCDDEEKRNRLKIHKNKKAKNKHYLEVASLGLHILPKQEWKRLRNLYLNSQRQKLAQLKHKANEALAQDTPEEETVEATEKTNPQTYEMMDVRGMAGVVYVDIVPDRKEVYVRCESAEIASSLLAAEPWSNTSLLQGTEEQWYWKKIIEDRSTKFQTKTKIRGRGKIKQHRKLPVAEGNFGIKQGSNNAIATKCTHIRFADNNDDEVTSNSTSAVDDVAAKQSLDSPTLKSSQPTAISNVINTFFSGGKIQA
ncbi:hypothetical protein B566_EDAN005168 [Ephemera danica]|nr:hypothetical protein B566_EDAN005168 [Ephemera danica]